MNGTIHLRTLAMVGGIVFLAAVMVAGFMAFLRTGPGIAGDEPPASRSPRTARSAPAEDVFSVWDSQDPIDATAFDEDVTAPDDTSPVEPAVRTPPARRNYNRLVMRIGLENGLVPPPPRPAEVGRER